MNQIDNYGYNEILIFEILILLVHSVDCFDV